MHHLNLYSKTCNNSDTFKNDFDVEARAEIGGDKLRFAAKVIKRRKSDLADRFVDASANLVVKE